MTFRASQTSPKKKKTHRASHRIAASRGAVSAFVSYRPQISKPVHSHDPSPGATLRLNSYQALGPPASDRTKNNQAVACKRTITQAVCKLDELASSEPCGQLSLYSEFAGRRFVALCPWPVAPGTRNTRDNPPWRMTSCHFWFPENGDTRHCRCDE